MALNAANRKSVRDAEKAAKLEDANRGAVVVSLMGTTHGRRYVWDKLSTAHIFEAAPIGDALVLAHWAGERNQGLQLLADVMQYAPEEFITAMREANGRRTEDAARDSSASATELGGSEEPGRELEGYTGEPYEHPGAEEGRA